MTLPQLISFFSARIIGSWTMEEWAAVLEQIKANRMRYGMGQWV
jgi:hypothetical protein